MKVLMVCLGNICRSPLAQGILEFNAQKMGVKIEVDSAGTSANHVGERPDPRSVAVGFAHGIDITYQRARQFVRDDFDRFDLIFVMDQSNYTDVLKLAPSKEHADKVHLIRDEEQPGAHKNVPDPYYGEEDGFEAVFSMLDKSAKAFLSKLV
jgi:protein-tyrosine phosphatase